MVAVLLHLLLLASTAQAWTLPFFSSAPKAEPLLAKHPYQTSFHNPQIVRRAGKALTEPSSSFPRGLRHSSRSQLYSTGLSTAGQITRQGSARAIFNSRTPSSRNSGRLRSLSSPAHTRAGLGRSQRLLNQAQAASAQLRTPRLQQSLRRADGGNQPGGLASHLRHGVHQEAPGVQGRIVYNRQRPSRKIANTPLKLSKTELKKSKKPVEKLVKKHEEKLAEKDDNLAVESSVVVTKVKPGKSAPTPKKSAAAPKPKVVKAPAADRAAYNAPPAPKFIIKQAGPSQTFGWVGPGRYAPLNIPNIFKAAGINTKWIPEDNEIFEAGLTYPAPSQKKAVDIADSYTSASQTVNYSAPSQKVKKAVNIANYNSPNAPAAVPPKYKPSSPAKAAYKKPTFEAPAPAPAYQAPEKQTYKTSKKKPTYKVASPKDPIKPSYETPAVPPFYEKPKTSKPVSFPTSSYNSQLTDSFPSGSQNSYSAANKVATKPSAKPSTATPRPVYRAPSTTTPATTTTSATTTTTTTASTTTTRSQYTYKASPAPSVTSSFRGSPTPRPFYGSPTPYYTPAQSYGSPTPTPYTYAPAPQPAYYQPAPASVYNKQPSAPFTSFAQQVNGKFEQVKSSNLKEQEAPVAAVIETAPEKGGDDDGEVFYIFYENEETSDKGVKSGLDLQRYIHEEVGGGSTGSQYSTSVPQGDLFADENSVPVFSIVEESKGDQEKLPKKLTQPVYYDIPIKVEESGEGFDPPTEIRTIFVPIENAINIPETFDINLGTSFGYNKKKNKQQQAGFPNFPNFGAGASSYDSPISSYDAPIAPSSNQGTVLNASPVDDQAPKKVIRKARKPSVLKPGFAYEPGHSNLPFGTRLGPRDQYDPLVLRR